ncbi:MAG TPA: hypothetical protein VGR90_02735 [Acidimicrobiales bacterium]|nr:hypothetical protein [Acidimicrobiales bacterium]
MGTQVVDELGRDELGLVGTRSDDLFAEDPLEQLIEELGLGPEVGVDGPLGQSGGLGDRVE